MFSLFKKKQAQSEPPLKKKIKDMKCRKINYVDEGFDTLASEMSGRPESYSQAQACELLCHKK